MGYLRLADQQNREVGPAKGDGTTYRTEPGAIKAKKYTSGNFALVVKTTTNKGDTVALRLFLGQIPSQTTQVISHMTKHPHRAMVACKLRRQLFTLKNGDVVDGMEMEWVNGKNLDNYVFDVLDAPNASSLLDNVLSQFIIAISEISASGFYHGDLSHGNIMVDHSGTVRLVDYDSARIEGQSSNSNEVGVQDYQHPSRSSRKTLELGDVYFSSLVVYVTLAALSQDTRLWGRHLNTDVADGLLFHHSENDLSSSDTPLWKDLDRIFASMSDLRHQEGLALLKSAVDSQQLPANFVNDVQLWLNTHWNQAIPPVPVPPVPVPPVPVPPVPVPPVPGPEAKPSPAIRPKDPSRPKPKPSPQTVSRKRQRVKPSPKSRSRSDANKPSPKNNLVNRLVDEDGTEWWEDDAGTWWYRSPGDEFWQEYTE